MSHERMDYTDIDPDIYIHAPRDFPPIGRVLVAAGISLGVVGGAIAFDTSELTAQDVDAEMVDTALSDDLSTHQTFVLEEGDTLWGVYAQTGVSVEKLQEDNGITDVTNIAIGTEIIVMADAEQAVEQLSFITEEKLAHIDSLDLSPRQRMVLIAMLEVGHEAQQLGYDVNITAMIGQADVESLFGESTLGMHNNFHAMTAKPGWANGAEPITHNDTDWNGDPNVQGFEHYGTVEDGIWAYIHRIQSGGYRGAYLDAHQFTDDYQAFVRALQHTVNGEGEITGRAGQPGVYSWAENHRYEDMVRGRIEDKGILMLTGGR